MSQDTRAIQMAIITAELMREAGAFYLWMPQQAREIVSLLNQENVEHDTK